MTSTKEIFDNFLASTTNIIKKGMYNENVSRELKMVTSLYEYIEVVINFYDDDEEPDFNNWTDVEGFGYGWLWLRHKEENWHKMMSKFVAEQADKLLFGNTEVHYVVHQNEDRTVYHFVTFDVSRKDIIVSFSNEEMFY